MALDSGGAGGGGGDGGPEGSDFVDGGSVAWGRLAGAMTGAVLALVGYASARWVALWSGGLEAYLAGVGRFGAAIVSIPFDGGARVIDSAWSSFAAFLPTLGIFAFPTAVVVTVGVLSAVFWGVSRLVWGV